MIPSNDKPCKHTLDAVHQDTSMYALPLHAIRVTVCVTAMNNKLRKHAMGAVRPVVYKWGMEVPFSNRSSIKHLLHQAVYRDVPHANPQLSARETGVTQTMTYPVLIIPV